LCVCSHLSPLANRVGVHIVQHRLEKRHALNTVRLLRLGLSRLSIHMLDANTRSAAMPRPELPPGTALLYPSDASVLLGAADPAPEHLVVVDGTWSHAKRIYRDNEWLQALPAVRLAPAQPSRYRIRVEPRQECLSTVEAVVAALRVLEPELQGTGTLLDAFDAMIDMQIAARGELAGRAQRKRPRQGAEEAVPPALTLDPSKVVATYAEAAPGRATWEQRHEAIRISAVRLDGSATFDALVVPRTAPDAHFCALLGIDASLPGAEPVASVMERFRAFCGPSAVLASWGPWTHRWLEVLCPEHERVLLKGVWANVSHAPVPDLCEVAESLGVGDERADVGGRAGERLGCTRALAAHLVGLCL
jgi:hypothetical protein